MEFHLREIGMSAKYRMQSIDCEVCGAHDFASLQSRGRIGAPGVYGPLPVVICRVCGFKMLNPRYEDRFYLDYYDELYRKVSFDEADAVPSEKYLGQQTHRGNEVRKWTENFLGPAAGQRMLDHGCASGATMLSWRENGWDTAGIDPHRPSVELGRDRFNLDIQLASGEKLPFADASFDVVLSLGSLEHVYQLDRSMNELTRVLKPGAHLIIRWRSDVIFGSPLEYYNHNHYRFLSRKTWRLLLARYGFETLAETDQRLEGWDSYEYILVRYTGDRKDARALAAKGEGDAAEQIAVDHRALRNEFAGRCRDLLAFARRPGVTSKDVVTAVRTGAISWRGLLGGEPDDVVKRALMEADRYLAEIMRYPEFLN